MDRIKRLLAVLVVGGGVCAMPTCDAVRSVACPECEECSSLEDFLGDLEGVVEDVEDLLGDDEV